MGKMISTVNSLDTRVRVTYQRQKIALGDIIAWHLLLFPRLVSRLINGYWCNDVGIEHLLVDPEPSIIDESILFPEHGRACFSYRSWTGLMSLCSLHVWGRSRWSSQLLLTCD
jgi:hypothetical protein